MDDKATISNRLTTSPIVNSTGLLLRGLAYFVNRAKNDSGNINYIIEIVVMGKL